MLPWRIIQGDVRKELARLEPDYFDAVLSDPPYGIRFMSKRWDYDVPSVNVFHAMLRVLKPGAHAAFFGGAKTYHRVAVNIEDARFEMRDMLLWLYGSGMAKSGDVSKDIDDDEGMEREVIGLGMSGKTAGMQGLGVTGFKGGEYEITAAASELGKHWEGYSTLLKPAVEPLVLARKAIEGTVVDNIRKWGTGVLNIPGCRVGTAGGTRKADPNAASMTKTRNAYGNGLNGGGVEPINAGRWPSNVIVDDVAGAMLDAQTGKLPAGTAVNRNRKGIAPNSVYGKRNAPTVDVGYGDVGGASRFFYCAKAHKRERGEGNSHPTIKPIALTKYMARLLLPPKTGRPRRILVPYSGVASEMIGCVLAGWDEVVGIEMNPQYIEFARTRFTRDFGMLAEMFKDA